MAHFIGYIHGNRGEASRLGTKDSGIRCQAQGWNIGVKVCGQVNSDGNDEFTVMLTSGSNGRKPDRCLGTFVDRQFAKELSDEELRSLKAYMQTLESNHTRKGLSGSFAHTEIKDVKDKYVLVKLKWGVQDGGRNEKHEQTFSWVRPERKE